MLRIVLYVAFCICLMLMVYLGFFKKDRVENRLEEIGRDPFDFENEITLAQKPKNRKILRYVKIPEKVSESITASGIDLRVEEFVMIWISMIFFPAMILLILGQSMIIVTCTAFIMALLPPMYIKGKRKQRLKNFGIQLGDALPIMSNSLRAGFSFEQAFASVSKDMPAPISQEFEQTNRELMMGVSLEKALDSLTQRMENSDMQLVVSAVLIQRKVGGNLAEILDTISETIQGRIRLKNHIKTLTAQGRYSGYLIGAVPVFLLFALSAISPDYMSVLYTTSYGIIILCIAAAMEFTAFVIIKKMITLE